MGAAAAIGMALAMAVIPAARDTALADTVIVNTVTMQYVDETGRHAVQSNEATTTVVTDYAIRGLVKDKDDSPVSSAHVTISPQGTATARSATVEAKSAVTGADGTYAVTELTAGVYDVHISGAGIALEVVSDIELTAATPVVTLETRAASSPQWSAGTHMVALPLAYADADAAAVLGVASGLKLARWVPDKTGGHYSYYGQSTDFGVLTPGTGYWLQVAAGDALAPATAGSPLGETDPHTVHLCAGWNLVGNPFAVDLNWASVMVQANGQTASLETAAANGWVRPYAWTYDADNGGYVLMDASYPQATRVLPVWRACWVRALIACDLVIPAPNSAAVATAASARSTQSTSGWRAQLVARVNGLRDNFNFFGIDAGASSSDAYANLQSPPAVSPYIDLGFGDGSGGNGSYRATDVRAATVSAAEWAFVVQTDVADGQAELTWPDLSDVPEQYRITLVDVDAQRSQYMRTTSSYVFNTGTSGSVRHFKIQIDSTPWARLQVTNVRQITGRATGGTTLSYDVSAASTVDIEIRSLTGQLVRALARGVSAAAGTNLMTWDGCDASGQKMPAGPYLCAVSATTAEGQAVKGMRTIVLSR